MPTQQPPRIDPARSAFFLDFDGTLIPFDPDGIDRPLVDDGLRSLLADLRTQADGALAIVSGRTIDVIDTLFSPLRLAASGEHGSEWRFGPDAPHGSITTPAGLASAATHCAAFAESTAGVSCELKARSLVMHFHGHPELREATAAAVQQVCTPESGLKLLHARGMVELKSSEANKGYAVARFMTAAGWSGRQPVFLGDDVTDEDGFMTVNALGGISVKVGPGSSHARYRLPDDDAVRNWLESLLDSQPD